jgi:hypothetical protein
VTRQVFNLQNLSFGEGESSSDGFRASPPEDCESETRSGEKRFSDPISEVTAERWGVQLRGVEDISRSPLCFWYFQEVIKNLVNSTIYQKWVTHIRGDEPSFDTTQLWCAWGHPHTRGGTGELLKQLAQEAGSPTYAGMNRPCGESLTPSIGVHPHTQG